MEKTARIWFFTDIHGSNACFKKFLNLIQNENKPNVLIIGGDLTGKQVVPLVESSNKTFIIPMGGKEIKKRENEKDTLFKELSDSGYYPYECTLLEYKKFRYDYSIQKSIFNKLVRTRLEEWMKLADNKIPSSEHCKVIINAGNDDPFFVDEILDKCQKIIRPESKVVELPANLKLLSTGYSNKTPWDCPRDISEDELKIKIITMTNQIEPDDKVIFNFHCPPYQTSLDLAYKINIVTKQKEASLGKQPTMHVGSKVIRDAIEYWQPLVSLHGHVHEVSASEILGTTICYNPGTDYKNGKLQGVFLQINQEGKLEFNILTKEEPRAQGECENWFNTLIKQIPIFGNIYKDYTSSNKQDQILSEIQKIKNDLENINTKTKD